MATFPAVLLILEEQHNEGGGILGFFTPEHGAGLRLVCRELCAAVEAAAWGAGLAPWVRARFGPTGRTLLSIAVLKSQPERVAQLLLAGASPQRATLQDLRTAQQDLAKTIEEFNKFSESEDFAGLNLDFFDPEAMENGSNFYYWDEGYVCVQSAEAMLNVMRRLGLDMREFVDCEALQDDEQEDPAEADRGGYEMDLNMQVWKNRKLLIDWSQKPLQHFLQAYRVANTVPFYMQL